MTVEMRKTYPLLLLLLLTGLLAACVSAPAPATQTGTDEPTSPPSAAQPAMVLQPISTGAIVNIAWQWAGFVQSNPPTQSSVPDPQRYTLTFNPDGTLTIQSDCNMVGGTYTLQGSSLTIALGPSTMAACGDQSLDQQFLALLSQVNTGSILDGRLILSLAGNAGLMGFDNGGSLAAEASVTAEQITNIVWQWADMVETAPAAQSVVPNPQNYTLTFLPDGSLNIQADCNVVGGTYTLQGNSLSITLGPSTMAYCGDQSLDRQYLAFLARVDSASLKDVRLILSLIDDAGWMGFNNSGSQ